MKKQRATAVFLAMSIVALSAASASAQMNASAQGEVNAGGGLGSGLNYMVKNILGESAAQSAPVAPQTMMMQMNTAVDGAAEADMSAPPQARTMSFKAAAANETMMVVALTEEGLHEHIQELLRNDDSLQSVDTAETHVRLAYAVPARAFGFVPVMAKITVGAYASGETRVSYPWYAFATKKLSNSFKAKVQERVKPLITSESFTLEQQQMLIDEIHLVLAGEFQSSTGRDQ